MIYIYRVYISIGVSGHVYGRYLISMGIVVNILTCNIYIYIVSIGVNRYECDRGMIIIYMVPMLNIYLPYIYRFNFISGHRYMRYL